MYDIVCVYCGEPAEATDHVVPRSRGGTDEPSNLVPVCKSCNSRKKDRLPSEWLGDEVPLHILSMEREAVAECSVLPRIVRTGPVGPKKMTFAIRITAEHRRAIEAAAQKNGQTPGEWAVQHLRYAVGLPSTLGFCANTGT